jgi:hypothetical protein
VLRCQIRPGPLWLDLDLDVWDRLSVWILAFINLSIKMFTFLVHEYTFWSIFESKKFPYETWPKISVGQDPDVFESWIQIRSKIDF